MFRRKICGIRSATDLATAIDAGVDAIGVICGVTHTSEDALSPASARDLVRLVPRSVRSVLVTHLTDADSVLALADSVGVDVIQLHGEISLDTVGAVRAATSRQILKAVHVVGPEVVANIEALLHFCDGLLLDSRTGDRLGGTGRTHDWTISREIVDVVAGRRPVILAGGLTPANVGVAIRTVGPDGVDVNSGVEDSRGDKDQALCSAFVSAADFGG
ncbi:phosphoribosylanthranilate isomerase [Antrihabitans sp. YC2-6]|nr:phosphoribosylanthranilate isomerase [Antrihabitans sp. YC2-6]